MQEFTKASKIKGIKVPHNKNTSYIMTAAQLKPAHVTLLLRQHIGKPAVRCVEKGEHVFVGTLVGKADGFISSNIHSSVSGLVTGISRIMTPAGIEVETVLVESDNLFALDPLIKPPLIKTPQQLVQAVQDSGLVGLGGAGFPSHVKLSLPDDSPVDTIVINAAECEPYLTSDNREILENYESILDGIVLLKKILGIKRVIIGIEDNKPEAIELLRTRVHLVDFEIGVLQSSYPQGAEKFLVANLTGRLIPAGKLPSDAGIIVLNVSAVSFIAQYAKNGIPLVNRRVTVDGGAIMKPQNLMVPVGTAVREVIRACGGYKEACAKLIMGGPMMGIALYDAEYPILKTTNGLLAFTKAEAKLTSDNPCIRCGRCVDTCPMRLSPAEIQTAYETSDPAWANRMGVLNCIECGCCTTVCPAKRPITQIMRLCKDQIRKAAVKK